MGRKIFEINTIEELRFVLGLQRKMQRTACLALDEIVAGLVTEENQHDEEYLAALTMSRECELLEKFAKGPTLSELDRDETLRTIHTPGDTFGVAAIVGEVLLAHTRAICDEFTSAHRTLLMVLLNEFDKPKSEDEDVVDTFIRVMRVELRGNLSAQERNTKLRGLFTPLADAMVLVCGHYKLIEDVNDEGWVLTQLGVRVLLHLFDAQRFLDCVSEAHKLLQAAVPKVGA